MPIQHGVCRLCCDTVEGTVQLIDEDLREMLQTVLTTIVSIS